MSCPRILMLHRILPVYDAENYYFQRQTAISWSRYITILDTIESNQYVTLTISQLSQSPPENAIFITFDDGYVDNAAAFDELLTRGMVATLFPVRDFIQQGFSPIDDMADYLMQADGINHELWQSFLDGRFKRLLRNLTPPRYRLLREKWFDITQDADSCFMTEMQLSHYASQGIELGIHGVSHRSFNHLSQAQLKKEIRFSKHWIIDLGQTIEPAICFPHGQYSDWVIEIASGFSDIMLTVDKPSNNTLVYRRKWITEEIGFPY